MSCEPDATSDERNECKRGKGDDACAERAGNVTKTGNGKRGREREHDRVGYEAG
jgi:hypothetical protein